MSCPLFVVFGSLFLVLCKEQRTKNKKASSGKKRPFSVFRERFFLSSPLRRVARRVGISTYPSTSSGRLLWLHRARPSATLDKRNLQLSAGIVGFTRGVSRLTAPPAHWPCLHKSKLTKTMGKKFAVFALCGSAAARK